MCLSSNIVNEFVTQKLYWISVDTLAGYMRQSFAFFWREGLIVDYDKAIIRAVKLRYIAMTKMPLQANYILSYKPNFCHLINKMVLDNDSQPLQICHL